MKQSSAKYNARLLAYLLKKHGCTNIVVAPGSRNAPLIMALSVDEEYETWSVPDERAAAFTALGMALESGKPAAVICTSGSAAANFLPAVTEAFYQKVPLVVITADRPRELTGQGIGQTIDQENIYGRHVLAEANLLRDPADDLARQFNQRKLNEALLHTQRGPIHINVPFEEPLYEKCPVEQDAFRYIEKSEVEVGLSDQALQSLAEGWNAASKIWVLSGQMRPGKQLQVTLQNLFEKSPFLLLTETLSNLNCACSIANIDRLLNSIPDSDKPSLAPDLVITIGGEVVSKMVKKFLQETSALKHWHVQENGEIKDTFNKLEKVVPLSAQGFIAAIQQKAKSKDSTWCQRWLAKNSMVAVQHQKYIEKAPFSDLKAFSGIVSQLPANGILHCANSASIRYSQLFDHQSSITHYANRGTSGIDGSTATAIGHATQTDKMVTLVTGDIAFMYDNAAFWNDRLPQNLRIIVMNNSGGNIFRIIKGPAQIEHFERFQETHHQLQLKAISDIYGIEFNQAHNFKSLLEGLTWLYAEGGLRILEVTTPRMESPEILADYFKNLKEEH